MAYHKRELEKVLNRYLNSFPVIAITGPRQSGKSTLLLHALSKKYNYITFDDPKIVADFTNDPDGFMQRNANRVIFDEVQYVPEIFRYLKIAVDNDRSNYGKFILTGSSQLLLQKNITESLAGRIGLLTLLPFQLSELPTKLLEESIYQGSYPELVNRNYKEKELWYSGYVASYLNKDVRILSNIGDLRDFQRFITLLAANTAQIINMQKYANDIGVSVPTIKRWISILEASYIIFTLPPFYKNFGKRITQRPKIYFYDTGLVTYLVGITTKQHYEQGPMSGAIFENYVVTEILKKEIHQANNAKLFYLRTNNNVEVDLIIERPTYKEFIEIKKTATFNPNMVKPLMQFMGKNDKGYVLYNGATYPYGDNIKIINYKNYLKQ